MALAPRHPLAGLAPVGVIICLLNVVSLITSPVTTAVVVANRLRANAPFAVVRMAIDPVAVAAGQARGLRLFDLICGEGITTGVTWPAGALAVLIVATPSTGLAVFDSTHADTGRARGRWRSRLRA